MFSSTTTHNGDGDHAVAFYRKLKTYFIKYYIVWYTIPDIPTLL